jgi:hypothetical protein
MAQPIPDLWPEIEQSQVVPPVAILREQAALLGKKTNYLLEGRVVTRTNSGRFFHSVYIVAPALDGYEYKLFDISHDERLYPVQINVASLNSEQEFMEHIRDILNSDKTKSVVSSLLAQVKATS